MSDAERFFDLETGGWGAAHMMGGAQKMYLANNVVDYASLKLTVTLTPVELKVGASAMVGRKQLIVYAPTAGTIYWGKLTDIQAGNGIPLRAGDSPLTIDIDPLAPIPATYAISDGSDRVIWVVEVK